jgi:hypothetical protein
MDEEQIKALLLKYKTDIPSLEKVDPELLKQHPLVPRQAATFELPPETTQIGPSSNLPVSFEEEVNAAKKAMDKEKMMQFLYDKQSGDSLGKAKAIISRNKNLESLKNPKLPSNVQPLDDMKNLAKMKALGSLGSSAGRIGMGALKGAAGLTPAGLAMNLAFTPSVGEDSDIPMGKSLMDNEGTPNRMPAEEQDKYEQLKGMFKGWKAKID